MSDQLIDEQIAEFRETFKIFDEDGDNMLSERELGTLLNALGTHPTQADLQTMLAEMECEEQGNIDFTDFLSLMAKKMKDSDAEEELIEAFKVFDRDGDGFISANELRNSMTNLGERLSHDEVSDMIKEADQDGDGQINYDEFVKMMMAK
mmetsp:Transcript_23159/g.65079  ORF Transcript_23159/g.65079 Transcript_23159/m.65079 type:complete len:150 (-) Transcript_23159:111-560(-)